MRSLAELKFRLTQEAANLRLWLAPPRTKSADAPAGVQLPAPGSFSDRLRSTSFRAELDRRAADVFAHRLPMPPGAEDTGGPIEWRRDYRNRVTSGLAYFRAIRYLDFASVGDHKVIWDLNRHQHLVLLAQACVFDDHPQYVREIEDQIDSWLAQNPFMRGINWASALEVGFRALSWLWIHHLVGAQLSAPFRYRLLAGLNHHGHYLEHNLSVYFSPNTHLLGEAVALHAIGVLMPHFDEAERWRRIGASTVEAQMDRQVREDGSHFEQSSYYHVYAVDFFLFHQLLGKTTEQYRQKLWRMADYLNELLGPTRMLPLIGDDDGGRVFHPYGPCERFGRATIATCAAVFSETRWPFDETDLHEQAAWWLGEHAFDHQPRTRDWTPSSVVFRGSGLAVLASETTQVLIDGGAFGPGSGGHSHSDSLSIIVRHKQEELLTDAGTYTYVADATLRAWFRGSAAHNTVSVDGQDQAVSNGPFRWTQKPAVDITYAETDSGHDLVEASCAYQGSQRSLVHRRSVLFVKAGRAGLPFPIVVVRDLLEGLPGTHLLEQFWHPYGAVRPHRGGELQIGVHGQLVFLPSAEINQIDGWRSRAFGEKQRAPVVVARRRTVLPATLWAVLTLSDDADGGATLRAAADGVQLDWRGEWSLDVAPGAAGRLSYRHPFRASADGPSTMLPTSSRRGPRGGSTP